MSYATVIKCDVCGKSKGDEKDWLITVPVKDMEVEGPGLTFTKWNGLTFTKWNEVIAEIGYAKHICGAECAHNVLSSFLSGS